LGINRQAFYEAIRRASIVAKAESNKVVLRCQDGVLAISAETETSARPMKNCPCSRKGCGGDGVQREYLQEALPVMESEVISLALSGPLNPA